MCVCVRARARKGKCPGFVVVFNIGVRQSPIRKEMRVVVGNGQQKRANARQAVVRLHAQCELRCIASNSGDDKALNLPPVYAGAVPTFKKQRFSARLALVTRRVGCNPVSEQFNRISLVGRHLKWMMKRRSTADIGNV